MILKYSLQTSVRPHPGVLPATRENICGVRNRFQGLTVSTSQLGPNRPWFDPDVGMLTNPDDRMAVYLAHQTPDPGQTLGDTHLNLSLAMDGLDSVARIGAIAKEAIEVGGMSGIILCCMGDGHGTPNSDPGALGYNWLMQNFREVYARIWDIEAAGESLAARVIFVPGYDGVVPDWQPPSAVDRFALMAREVIDRGGAGYLGLELSAGYCKWGHDDPNHGEDNNWETEAGKAFDVILQEGPVDMGPPYPVPPGPPDARWSQVYSMAQRMIFPWRYVPGQHDDMDPPFLLAGGTPRGIFFYCFWEFDTFSWTLPWRRGGSPYPLELVLRHRQALRDMGCVYVG